MKVLLMLLKGFEHMESSVFIDVMGWTKSLFDIEMEVETCGFDEIVSSSFYNTPIRVNHNIKEIDVDEYDALAIPGGFAAYGFHDEGSMVETTDLIRAFDDAHKPIASVCVGSIVLGRSGILNGRLATTYHLEGGRWQRQLAELGAKVVNEPVVMDDNVITSYCPQTAPYVAFELLEKLTDQETRDRVMKEMGY